MNYLTLLALFFLPFLIYSQNSKSPIFNSHENIITIADAKADLNGDYVPDMLGQRVTISGVVLNKSLGATGFQVFIQDYTGGIQLFNFSNPGPNLDIGDSVIATGTIDQYEGLSELVIDNPASDITVLKTNCSVKPATLTINEYLENGELYEGTLVKIETVFPSPNSPSWPIPGNNENLKLWTGSGSELTARIDKDTDVDDSPEPSWPITFTGIGSQFDATSFPDSGYQIIFRRYDDIRWFLTSQLGGEQYIAENDVNIEWIQRDSISNVRIELSIDNGNSWTMITESTRNDGLFIWTIPNILSSYCKIRLSDSDDLSIFDESPNPFTIREIPTAPEILADPKDVMKFEGETATLSISAESYDEILYQWWQIGPEGLGDIKLNNVDGRIKGVNTDTLTILNPSLNDSSKQFYCILANALDPINLTTTSSTAKLNVNKSLYITNPSNQEIINVGSFHTITWLSNYDVGNIRIEYSIDGGDNWLPIAEVSALIQSYTWLVPDTPSENCKIRIYSTTNSNITDYSEGTFTIFLLQSVSASIIADSDWMDEQFNGYATGKLDGSESKTNYGEILEYNWIKNNDTIATGKQVNIQLQTGTHSIILEIKTNQNIYDYDTVQISVYGSLLNTGAPINSSLSSFGNQYYYLSSTDNKLLMLDSNGYNIGSLLADSPMEHTPIVYDEKLLFASSLNRIYCFNNTFIPNWDKSLGSKITSTPSISPKKEIVVGLENGRLYILDTEGNILNNIQTSGAIYSSPAITDEGIIYFGSSDGNFYSASFDGEILNTFSTGDTIMSSPAIGRDSSVVIGSNDGKLYKLDRELNTIWDYQTKGKIISSPVIDENGDIYFGSTDSSIYSLSKNGIVNWQYKSNSEIRSDLSLDKYGNVYIGTEDGKLLVLKDGNLLWQFITSSKIRSASLITNHDLLLQSTIDGSVYIMSISESSKPDSNINQVHQWPTYKGNNQRNGYVWDGVTDINTFKNEIPVNYSLAQNYPNPFNPSTKIKFGLPKESKVSLVVYNLLGQVVTKLVNQQLKAGYHEVEFNNTNYSSGIYFYRLQAGDYVETKKMILLK